MSSKYICPKCSKTIVHITTYLGRDVEDVDPAEGEDCHLRESERISVHDDVYECRWCDWVEDEKWRQTMYEEEAP